MKWYNCLEIIGGSLLLIVVLTSNISLDPTLRGALGFVGGLMFANTFTGGRNEP